MSVWIWLLIAAAVVAIAAVAFALSRQRRTIALRQKFGTEYDRTVEARDNRREAESDLRDRASRRAEFDLRPLTDSSLQRYTTEWSNAQAQFVDQPTEAVRSADALVHRVMSERGYPMDNFESEADLVSVDHPEVVDNFRSAHRVFEEAQAQQATTEDLRSAMLHYRSLFDRLLKSATTGDTDASDAPARATVQASGRHYARNKGTRNLQPDEPAIPTERPAQ